MPQFVVAAGIESPPIDLEPDIEHEQGPTFVIEVSPSISGWGTKSKVLGFLAGVVASETETGFFDDIAEVDDEDDEALCDAIEFAELVDGTEILFQNVKTNDTERLQNIVGEVCHIIQEHCDGNDVTLLRGIISDIDDRSVIDQHPQLEKLMPEDDNEELEDAA